MLNCKNYYYKTSNITFKFERNNNILYLFNKISYVKVFLPSIYFYSTNKLNINFIYLNKITFISVLKQLLTFFNVVTKFYFFRIRLRGLGYKIKKYAPKLYRFFFAYNHYFYFHVPLDIFIKRRRRTLIFFCHNKAKLNDIFSHLILLKKLDLYERNNTFIVSRQIKFFKKRK
jgi:hypothetical protein